MASAQTLVAGRYRLQQQLGAGGMGLVWQARDEVLGRDVAIKEVVPPAGLSEVDRAELRLRTLREARTAARLNHPNVVKIYDVVHTEEWPWIVMEYVPSRSLHDVITSDSPLNPNQVARIGLSVLNALIAAHQAGVLHRDVKPGNVLIADDGRVVLTDFGLATFDDTDGVLTVPGLVLGSAQYVAPERARDGTSTPQTDLWSLGATLYAAVEGRSPYARSTTMATLTALATALPDPPRRAGALKPVLSGLLRRNPKDRMSPAVAERALLRVATQGGTGRWRIPGQRRGRVHGGRVPAGLVPADRALLLTGADRTATIPAAAPDPGRTTAFAPEDGTATRRGWPVGHRRDRRPGHRRARWPVGHRRERWFIMATLIAVLLAGLGTVLARSAQGRDAAIADRTRPGAARPTTAPVLGTAVCASKARAAPVAAISTPPGWDAPPPGFVWYLDPSGFRISVPAGWAMTSGPGGVCFREPGDTRVLAVQAFPPDGDPVAHLLRQEAALDTTGRPTNYTNLGIGTVQYYFVAAAQWEYTFRDAGGTTQHGLSRCFIASAQRAYTIVWRTRDLDWQPNLDQYRVIIASFRQPD